MGCQRLPLAARKTKKLRAEEPSVQAKALLLDRPQKRDAKRTAEAIETTMIKPHPSCGLRNHFVLEMTTSATRAKRKAPAPAYALRRRLPPTSDWAKRAKIAAKSTVVAKDMVGSSSQSLNLMAPYSFRRTAKTKDGSEKKAKDMKVTT